MIGEDTAVISAVRYAHSHLGNTAICVQMIGDRNFGRLLGFQVADMEGVAHRINSLAVALHRKMTVEEFSQCDLAYAPPLIPVLDLMLTVANQMLKEVNKFKAGVIFSQDFHAIQDGIPILSHIKNNFSSEVAFMRPSRSQSCIFAITKQQRQITKSSYH